MQIINICDISVTAYYINILRNVDIIMQIFFNLWFFIWIDMIGEAIPGMVGLIRNLKGQGYRLYGLSNWARETFNLVEDRFEAFSLLDGYLISGDAKLLKPDPAIYQACLSRFGLDAGSCLFVDDNPVNVAAAEAQGIRSIRFTSPEALVKELHALGIPV